MAVKWTQEQQRVIDTRDRDILVSAAAGSGKTAVLVARILAMITDETHPVDIDRLLVVTFTNAAAAEMRERIRDALEERAEEEPDNVHLQRQLVLVHNARITTIHSFCLSVLRSHFQLAGIDPSFRVADEGEMLLLEQETVHDTVSEAYGQENEDFRDFVEAFAPGKSDRIVEETVLGLYHYALGQPWPKQWLESCCRMYEEAAESDETEAAEAGEAEASGTGAGKVDGNMCFGDTAWLAYIVEDTKKLLADIRSQAEAAVSICEETDGPYPYLKALQSDLAMIDALSQAPGQAGAGETYRFFAQAFRAMPAYARLGTKKDPGISEEKKQLVQSMRSDMKEGLAALRKRYYYEDEKTLLQEFHASGKYIRVLAGLTEAFMDRLAAEKAERNILDFGDIEHFALRVLAEAGDGSWKPTAAAREYAETLEEIMIDEYQDSNLVQEIILNSVSRAEKGLHNMFMVGDVKQSIYRFRLARPELFMGKYKTYRTDDGGTSCRIDLHRNFRSRSQVLESVNYIFRQIMTEGLGGICYDKDAALYPGAGFPARGEDGKFLHTECLLLSSAAQTKQQEEAKLVGRRIREIVGTETVLDKESGTYRPARYGDIVILLRTVSGWAETFGEALADMGIPCFTGSQKGYFSAAEIRIVLSYLQILDNPIQDIPLAAVLRSAIGGLSDDELAAVRSFSDCTYYYDACQEYRKNGADESLRGKLEQFFAVFEKLRAKCGHTPVHMLIWEILEETGYGAYAEALPAGRQRKANLDMLAEKAIAYEATSYRGLYHFVRYIENLKKYEVDYGEASIGSEASDTVRIMSIHKSKGLEFPIVFVSGLGKQFNESDIRSRTVMHPEFGIACDFVDTKLRTRQATLLKKAIQSKTASENLGEELRVLYVAMTRAKEKLILTGAAADAPGKLAKWQIAAKNSGETLSYSQLSGASSYLDWVIPAILRHPDGRVLLDEDGQENPEPQRAPGDRENGEADCALPEDSERTEADRALPEGAKGGETEPAPDGTGSAARFDARLVPEDESRQDELQAASGQTVLLEELMNWPDGRECDRETQEYLEHVFHASYPYEKDSSIIGKLSVSEIKKLSHIPEEEEAEELYRPETVIPLIPGFREEKKALSGAARGTAYHNFMENLDYSRKDELERQLEELVNCGKMSAEEGAVLCPDDIRTFLLTDSGRRMERAAAAGLLFRERPFVLGVQADVIRRGWNPQQTVLVQGIIDAYFIEDGQITVLDYKTDRVGSAQELVEKYRPQLDYYAAALERLLGRPVKDRIIYSFHLGEDIIL